MTVKHKVAIGVNESGWHLRFMDAFNKYADPKVISIDLVNIDHSNWVSIVSEYDSIIWKPHYMGVEAAGYFKDKIYFIENHLNKIITPNFASIWHFENKAAQSYIFTYEGVPTPNTVVSFSLEDSFIQLDKSKMPIVYKKTFGASSNNVEIIHDRKKIANKIKSTFSRDIIKSLQGQISRFFPSHLVYLLKCYYELNIKNNNQKCIYWQDFVSGHDRDLRVTVIGDKYAYGFWRQNRPGDFRASGSGLIDYISPIPKHLIQYCMDFSKKMNFDSMAYDILLSKNGDFEFIEMSYGYVDKAIYGADGYYELSEGEIEFVHEKTWPQDLWVRWHLDKILKNSVVT